MEIINLSKHIEIHPAINTIIVKNSNKNMVLKIENQIMKIFLLLLNKEGQLVTKEEFIDLIWEGNSHVGEQALTKNIFKLRKLFKEIGIAGDIEIETIPKRGYRLIKKSQKRYRFNTKQIIYSGGFIAAILIVLFMWQRPDKDPDKAIKVIKTNNNDSIIYLDENDKVQEIQIDSLN